tara:strand:+ start:63 stop:335 length:273 start_codon:yes stop_codon:yes gene_type:complete
MFSLTTPLLISLLLFLPLPHNAQIKEIQARKKKRPFAEAGNSIQYEHPESNEMKHLKIVEVEGNKVVLAPKDEAAAKKNARKVRAKRKET